MSWSGKRRSYLMTRKINSDGHPKMVLSGEGADEIIWWSIYISTKPPQMQKTTAEETCRKLDASALFDCARANKSTSAWGVKTCTFPDKKLYGRCLCVLNAQDKMCVALSHGKMDIRKHLIERSISPAEVYCGVKKTNFG